MPKLIGIIVSIPVGFSRSLRRPQCGQLWTRSESVSIPVGFSRSLRLKPPHLPDQEPPVCFNPCRVFSFAATRSLIVSPVGSPFGFNPCRVFSFAATGICRSPQPLSSWFQSLSGFLVRCDKVNGLSKEIVYAVSIPVGFSRSLRPQETPPMIVIDESFNPCRVFSFAATW